MKKRIAYIIFSFFSLVSAGQNCEEPAGLISVYYSGSTAKSRGVGLEAGFLHEISPVGLYLGCNYIRFQTNKENETTGNEPQEEMNFYVKLAGRVVRIENKFSAFLVASPVISFRSKLDFQTGVKLLAPLSEKMALQVEPLYVFRQGTCLFHFHFSFIL